MIPRVLERTIELPIGLEEDGVVHRDLVLGPLTVRGSYQAEAWALQPHPDMPAQAWRGMCRMAAQVRRVGTKTVLTPHEIVDMAEADMDAILAAKAEVDALAASFRGKPAEPTNGVVSGRSGNGVESPVSDGSPAGGV